VEDGWTRVGEGLDGVQPSVGGKTEQLGLWNLDLVDLEYAPRLVLVRYVYFLS